MKKIITLAVTAAIMMCTAVSAFAVDFTPSVTNPGGPAVEVIGNEEPSHGEDGDIVGYLTDGEGNVISTEYKGCFWVASLEEALDEDSEMSDNLRKYLKDLLKDFEEGKVDFEKIEGLEEVIGKYPVARDLFYAEAVCDYLKENLPKENTFIELTFKANVNKDEPFAVIIKNGDEWELAEKVTVNEDGTVTVKMENLGAIAFLVAGEEPEAPVDAPVEEEKGISPLAIGVPVVGAGGLAAYFMGKKKKEN